MANTLTPALRIDTERCIECRACNRECPICRFHHLERIEQVSAFACLRCGHCLAVCPTGAIDHPALPENECVPLSSRNTPDDALMLMAQRRSVRDFTDQPVARADWEALLMAMSVAPSGLNARPVHAIVTTDREILTVISAQTVAFYRQLMHFLGTPGGRLALRLVAGRSGLRRLQKSAGELTAICAQQTGRDPILHGAPGVMLLHAPVDSPTGSMDCLLAAMHAMLFAPTLGLGTCMIGFVLPAFARVRSLQQRVGLPRGHVISAVLAVGHPATAYHRIPPRPAIPTEWLTEGS